MITIVPKNPSKQDLKPLKVMGFLEPMNLRKGMKIITTKNVFGINGTGPKNLLHSHNTIGLKNAV